MSSSCNHVQVSPAQAQASNLARFPECTHLEQVVAVGRWETEEKRSRSVEQASKQQQWA